MAYKIQVGLANLSGSISVPGDVDVLSGSDFKDVTTGFLSSSGDIEVLGKMDLTVPSGEDGKIEFDTVATHHRGTIASNGDKIMELGKDGNNDGFIKLFSDDSAKTQISVGAKTSAGAGFLELGTDCDNNGTRVALDGDDGTIYANLLAIGGDLTVGRNATLTDCKLIVAGGEAQLATGSLTISDNFMILASGSGGAEGTDGAGFIFGRDNTSAGNNAASDGGLLFAYSDTGNKFQAKEAINKSKFSNISASFYYAPSSQTNLTKNMTVGGTNKTIIEHFRNAGSGVQNDITHTGPDQRGLLHVVSGNASTDVVTLRLPTAANMADGNFVRIKNAGAANLIIKTRSSETIDGVDYSSTGLTLTDASVALDIACDGNNFFIL